METEKEDKVSLLGCDYCKNTDTQSKSNNQCECEKIIIKNPNEISLAEQPDFHTKKINCCDILFKNFKKNCAINKLELNSFEKIKQVMQISYDENNTEHENLLFSLYELVFNKTPTENLRSDDWKQLGFQSDNPRTDFRAGGYFSLIILLHFARYYSEELEEILKLKNFMFAIIAIKLTFLSKIYFNLVDDDNYALLKRTHKVEECTRLEFKNFCEVISINSLFYQDLLSKSLIFIKNRFAYLYDHSKDEENILVSDKLIKEAMDLIKKSMNTNCVDPNAKLDDIMWTIEKEAAKFKLNSNS